MIKLYEIKVAVELSEEDMNKLKREAEEFDEPLNLSTPIAVFHLGGYSLLEVASITEEKCKDNFSEGYSVLSIEEMASINILNWEEDECPYCAAEEAPLDDIIEFECSCGASLRVADTWKFLECKECGREIDRTHVIGSGGKYLLVDASTR